MLKQWTYRPTIRIAVRGQSTQRGQAKRVKPCFLTSAISEALNIKKQGLTLSEVHHPNSENPEPENADELYKKSIRDKNGVRWAKDENGVIHRFSKPSNGTSHWSGSTGDEIPIQERNIPNDILKLLDQ